MIEARGLSKRYGERVVLERIDARVAEGEFVTLVGTSGCGKTTFLRLLLGVEHEDGGQLLLDGRPVPREPGPDRGIVFQQYSVFPHMTALDNVMAARAFRRRGASGYLFGAAKRAARADAVRMLERVGLGDALARWPHELSGGMRQRLALAQALLAGPRVLLLDEPFGALDPGVRHDMQELVLELWRELGLTVFMVTHDLAEGFRLGTRLWVFDRIRPDAVHPADCGATITYDLPLARPVPDDAHGTRGERGSPTAGRDGSARHPATAHPSTTTDGPRPVAPGARARARPVVPETLPPARRLTS